MNPKVREFLEKYPETTLISLGWAMLWRLYTLILGVCIALAIIGEILS